MRLMRIEVKSFKPFRDLVLPSDDEDLPDGLILIRGLNSTGKSSLFEAILWALWGARAVGLTNDELIPFSSSFCKVVLEFEVAGTRYKLDRSYDPANKMQVLLYFEKEHSWKRMADKSMTVERTLEGILNLELDQALNTLLVRQGEVARIAYASPSDLRKQLVAIYNVDLLDKMTNHLQNLESNISARLAARESVFIRPEVLQEMVEEGKERVTRLGDEVGEKNIEVEKADELLGSLPNPDDLKAIHDLRQEIKTKEDEHDRSVKARDKDLKSAGLVDSDPRIVKAKLKSLEKEDLRLEEEREELRVKKSDIDSSIGRVTLQINEAKANAESVQKDKTCPICFRILDEEEMTKLLEEYQQIMDENSKKLSRLEKEKAVIPAEMKRLETRQRTISTTMGAVERITEHQKEVDAAQKRAEKAASKLAAVLEKMDVDDIELLLKKHDSKSVLDLQLKINKFQSDLDSLKRECQRLKRMLDDEKAKIKEYEGKEASMKEMEAEIASLKSMDEHTKYVRRKLVSGFIADYVFQKRLIGIIRSATNQYVSSFTSNQYTAIDLEPTPAKGKAGPGLVLRIWDDRDKANKKTSQLSYGDRTAISLGLRLGISRTMSSIRPLKDSPATSPRVRSVLLDEPLGGLDRNRRMAVVQNLIGDESFEQIFLITHTDIQGWEGVPVIEVKKSGSVSTAILSRSSDA